MPALTNPDAKPIDPQRLAELRLRAAARLTGAAATKGSAARAVDALGVLHALASSPKTAPDALALLHELQVHQVELDLQAQELQESRAELESALRQLSERHDALPVGCFSVDARGVVRELNRTACAMLGIPEEEALGLPLGSRLGADGAQRLLAALAACAAPATPDAGGPRSAVTLELTHRGGTGQPVLASVGRDAVAGRYLVTLAGLDA